MELELECTLCDEQGITFKNIHYVPNRTCGFFKFEFSKSFPAANVYGTTLHPNVIAGSYQSLIHQNLNLEHKLRIHDPDKQQQDTVIGSIVNADFPVGPSGGWTVDASEEKAPLVTGVASFFKQVHRLDKVFGEHLTGRHVHTVSMEVDYPFQASGFAVQMNSERQRIQGDAEKNFTPQDFLRAGWEYWPVEKSPDALLATFSKKKNRIVGTYKGRKVLLLMGGLDSEVHYAGLALVRYGAEPAAQILKTAASAPIRISQVFQSLNDAVTCAAKQFKK